MTSCMPCGIRSLCSLRIRAVCLRTPSSQVQWPCRSCAHKLQDSSPGHFPVRLPVQEQFARLLLAQQQQNAAQQQLLQSMREGMAGGGGMQGAHPSLGSAGGNVSQLANQAPALTASMQVTQRLWL